MIDTVVLKIARFDVSPDAKMGEGTKKFGTGFWSGSIQVLPPDGCDETRYFPVLHVVRHSKDARAGNEHGQLNVQVSVGKLLFGTNLAEAGDGDIEPFISALTERMGLMGVWVEADEVRHGKVTRVDFSKNVLFDPPLDSAIVAIADIGRIDYRPRSDFKGRTYSPGESVQFSNTSRSFGMYAKMCELSKNACTQIEKELADGFRGGRMRDDILRIEESLRVKLAIQRASKRYRGVLPTEPITLAVIWDSAFSRFTLLRSFVEIYGTPFADVGYWYEHDPEATLAKLHAYISSPVSRGHVMDLVRSIARVGIKNAAMEFKRKFSAATLSRTKKLIEMIPFDGPASSADAVLATVGVQLREFVPMTLDDVKEKIRNSQNAPAKKRGRTRKEGGVSI